MAQEPQMNPDPGPQTDPATDPGAGGERTPEEIRADIEGTRADMDRTLDEIEDRVHPARIRQRQADRISSRWDRMKTSVMGAGDNGRSSANDRAEGARARVEGKADSVRQAPDAALQQTRGNPLAAGLIAFGLGALAGSLLPSSRAEQQAAQQLRDRFEEPVKQEVQRMGQQAKEELQPSAQEAVERTKQAAQDATERTKDQAQSSAQDVRDETQQARHRIQ